MRSLSTDGFTSSVVKDNSFAEVELSRFQAGAQGQCGVKQSGSRKGCSNTGGIRTNQLLAGRLKS